MPSKGMRPRKMAGSHTAPVGGWVSKSAFSPLRLTGKQAARHAKGTGNATKSFLPPPHKRLLKMALCASLLTAPCLVSAQQFPGWHPVLRPTPAGFGSYTYGFGDYDWTGLTDKILQYDDLGGETEYPFTLYGGVTYTTVLTDFGSDFPFTSDIISGGSTYKWSWSAPLDQNPQVSAPDTKNFPAPPLFTLGTLLGGYGVSQDIGASGLSAISTINYLDGKKSQITNVIPASYPFMDFQILPSTFDAPSQMASSVLKPRAGFVEMGAVSAPAGSGHSNFAFYTHADSILLHSPNPFKNPDILGDAFNWFVYDEFGDLRVDAEITCNAAVFTQDGYPLMKPPQPGFATSINLSAKYLAKNVDWKTDIKKSPDDGDGHTTLLHYDRKDIADNNGVSPGVVPDTRGANGVHDMGHLIFEGLPVSNKDFGNHTVTLTVATPNPTTKSGDGGQGGSGVKGSGVTYNDLMVAHIQTFYKATASNYPSAVLPTDPAYEPNFMYYYAQTLSDAHLYPTSRVIYDATLPANVGSRYTSNDDTIRISPTAIPLHYTFHIFALPAATDPDQFVKWIGNIQISGLIAFTRTAAHENTHRTNFFQDIQFPNKDGIGADGGDNDGLDDSWEASHYFRSNLSDTTGAYSQLDAPGYTGPDAGKADRECLCDIVAYGAIVKIINPADMSKGLWKQDWADVGVQHALHFTYPPGIFYPVSYVPVLTVSPPTYGPPIGDLPSNALMDYPPLKQ